MTKALDRIFTFVTGHNPVQAGLCLALRATLLLLGAVLFLTAVTLLMHAVGVDVTREVLVIYGSIDHILSAAGYHVLGAWTLYSYSYLVVAVVAAAAIGRSYAAPVIVTQVSRVLHCLLFLIALAVHLLVAGANRAIPFGRPDLAAIAAQDHTPPHLAVGWRPGVDPLLLYG